MKDKEVLHQVDIFSELDDAEAATIFSWMREKLFDKGRVIFNHYDEGGGLFIIISGKVKISRIGRDGREVTMALLGEGNFFGEMSLFDGQPRSATATAVVPSRLLVLEREVFLSKILPMTGIVAKMLTELSKRLRAADQIIENLAMGTVFDRLFHILGHLGRHFPIKEDHCFISKRPTHQELAELVGSTRETVTRTLAMMEKNGLIEIRKKGVVLLPSFFERERAHS